MTKQELMEFLKENLSIEVETKSNYTGGLDGGDLYKNTHTLKLCLDDEVISECNLD